MCVINKHQNFEVQLSSISDEDSTKFELLSLHIDWVLQRFPRLSDEDKFQCEVSSNLYIIEINKSTTLDIGLKILFKYKDDVLTLISVKEV